MNLERLKNIRVVLVQTTHPGNIGGVARAMLNMGLQKLYLVQPKLFPHPEATARASGAQTILENAIVTQTLDEALADCGLVFGTSARMRALAWPVVNPRQAAEQILQIAENTEVAILFGQESSGLSNIELQRCNYLLNIPCNPDFSSLNLAAAVQVVAYELRMQAEKTTTFPTKIASAVTDFATAEQMVGLYQHLEQTLLEINFVQASTAASMMHRLHRLFNRAQLEQTEVNILRGILTAVQKRCHPEQLCHPE
jgi:tRNA (cytidine32/uridine32-2'-O)-methyltransferase